MKRIFTICCLIFITCDLFAQDLNTQSPEESNSQKFIIPEKFWKTECLGTASNVMVDRIPNDKGSLDVDVYRTLQIDTSKVSILTGSLCDMVKGYDNSRLRIYGGKYIIKPCSGSEEKDIEISSQGLEFVYHTGIGLEYKLGNGTIKMFDKLYEFPIERK
jgi:hypothetical protein